VQIQVQIGEALLREYFRRPATGKQELWLSGQPHPFPPRLYKFLEAKHANALCTQGSIRVGTLYEYRRQEQYSHGVLDREQDKLTHREYITSARVDQLTVQVLVGSSPRRADRGIIPAVKLAKFWRFDEGLLREWLKTRSRANVKAVTDVGIAPMLAAGKMHRNSLSDRLDAMLAAETQP
jgi:hypothetical protein